MIDLIKSKIPGKKKLQSQSGSSSDVTREQDCHVIKQQVAVFDDEDGLHQQLFRPTKTFYKYIVSLSTSPTTAAVESTSQRGRRWGGKVPPDEVRHYLPCKQDGYVYPHAEFMRSHFICAKIFQNSLTSNSVRAPSLLNWSKPGYCARITSDIMLRDSIALRTEVEIRLREQLAKLAVMGVPVDQKTVADNRRLKRRDAVQIPTNTSTKRMVSTESNAQWTVRKGVVAISPDITGHFSKTVTPMNISSQEALQWTFISAFDFSFMSERFTLKQRTSCKIDVDFVTTTLYIRVANTASGFSLEDKMKLSSIALKANARKDISRMEFELLDMKQLQQEKLLCDQTDSFFCSHSTNQQDSTIDEMKYPEDVNIGGIFPIHPATSSSYTVRYIR